MVLNPGAQIEGGLGRSNKNGGASLTGQRQAHGGNYDMKRSVHQIGISLRPQVRPVDPHVRFFIRMQQ